MTEAEILAVKKEMEAFDILFEESYYLSNSSANEVRSEILKLDSWIVEYSQVKRLLSFHKFSKIQPAELSIIMSVVPRHKRLDVYRGLLSYINDPVTTLKYAKEILDIIDYGILKREVLVLAKTGFFGEVSIEKIKNPDASSYFDMPWATPRFMFLFGYSAGVWSIILLRHFFQ